MKTSRELRRKKVRPVRDKIIVNFSHVEQFLFFEVVGNSGVCCLCLLFIKFWSLMSIEKWVKINEIMALMCVCVCSSTFITFRETKHIYHWRDKWVPLDNPIDWIKREEKNYLLPSPHMTSSSNISQSYNSERIFF